MTDKVFALIPIGQISVENLIIASGDYTQENYELVEVKSGVYCSPGMFYNSSTGLFYQDEAFENIFPVDQSSLLIKVKDLDSGEESS